jgi:methionyl-tRNA formyltransferase
MNSAFFFFGNSAFSLPVLDTLKTHRLLPRFIVTSANRPAGRHLQLTPNPVKVFAAQNQLPVLESPAELARCLADLPPSDLPLGLVAAYGRIIRPPVLAAFSGRLYNLHPSLLPLYRGPSPLQAQILDRVTVTGVTLMLMDAQVDHGPILGQVQDQIGPADTTPELGRRLFTKGTELFLDFLARPENYPPSPQSHSRATFTHLLTRESGFIPYPEFVSQVNSSHPDLLIKFRALHPWPGVWTTDPQNRRLKLTAVSPQILVQIAGKTPTPLTEIHF